MHIFREIKALQAHLRTLRSTYSSVGFVPTMGALHDGHLSLLRAARHENAVSICSIYVNPTQFGNPADLEKYPRTLEADLALLRKENCDVVFCPNNDEMYGQSPPISLSFPGLDKVLEGEFRPGHFSGVAQVVAKLFHIVEPDRAYFGEKDFQQVLIVRRLVEALSFNVKIVSLPIVREADGLALSSRNQRLQPADRIAATVLYAALNHARQSLLQGETLERVRAEAKEMCAAKGVSLEYLALAETKALTLLERVTDPHSSILLMAAQVGPVRLIDNLRIQTA